MYWRLCRCPKPSDQREYLIFQLLNIFFKVFVGRKTLISELFYSTIFFLEPESLKPGSYSEFWSREQGSSSHFLVLRVQIIISFDSATEEVFDKDNIQNMYINIHRRFMI